MLKLHNKGLKIPFGNLKVLFYANNVVLSRIIWCGNKLNLLLKIWVNYVIINKEETKGKAITLWDN